jgi:hypothetical protein
MQRSEAMVMQQNVWDMNIQCILYQQQQKLIES